MIEIQLNSLIQAKETKLLELSESSNIITEATDETILANFENSDILANAGSNELSNICNFCKKTFCNEKYLQIHISKQHKFL